MINELYDGCVQFRRRWTGDVGEFSLVDEAATDKLMQEAAQRIEMLELALRRIALCDWPGPLPLKLSRADWLQEIAKEALK
jgi:hypothetical protein